MNSVEIPTTVHKDWCDRHLDLKALPEFSKKVTTRAVRMDGAFTVETDEGPLTCQDGWLCFDARGYPYPVATDEFEFIYESVKEDDAAGVQYGAAVQYEPGTVETGPQVDGDAGEYPSDTATRVLQDLADNQSLDPQVRLNAALALRG